MSSVLKLLLLFSIFLAGCSPERREDGAIIAKDGSFGFATQIERVEFSGHDYIVFRIGVSEGISLSSVHDPDCRCQK